MWTKSGEELWSSLCSGKCLLVGDRCFCERGMRWECGSQLCHGFRTSMGLCGLRRKRRYEPVWQMVGLQTIGGYSSNAHQQLTFLGKKNSANFEICCLLVWFSNDFENCLLVQFFYGSFLVGLRGWASPKWKENRLIRASNRRNYHIRKSLIFRLHSLFFLKKRFKVSTITFISFVKWNL